jgi:hypothetical protein
MVRSRFRRTEEEQRGVPDVLLEVVDHLLHKSQRGEGREGEGEGDSRAARRRQTRQAQPDVPHKSWRSDGARRANFKIKEQQQETRNSTHTQEGTQQVGYCDHYVSCGCAAPAPSFAVQAPPTQAS